MHAERRIVRARPSTLYRDLGGDAILLQLDTGEYFGLDAVAHRMWQLMVEKGDLAEVLRDLQAEYAGDPDRIAADLNRLVAELVESRLVDLEVSRIQA